MAPHATDAAIKDWSSSHGASLRNVIDDRELDLHSSLDDDDLVEPVAVVGFSFKFPQDADSTDSFWKLLMEQRSTATEFPQDRLSVSAFYHPDPSRKSTLPFNGGHFLKDDIAAFDAPFFSISDSEAASLDPQQRGLLETTYRALENSGIPMKNVFGSKTSVFTGCFTNDWQQLSLKDPEHSSTHTALGIEASMNANRISWFFNFKGTSFNVDSACSSSLVTLDLACTSLITKAADMSIATGCNLILYPDLMRTLSNMNMLSPDNQCFAFDSRANGYARGEGFGVLVLKRLTDALRDNDIIRAVIRSTGSNQDGRTAGITQPSGDAQAALIRETYSKAGLTMNKTRYFEAHGTGTALGDPTEVNALGEAFRHTRSPDDPLIVGAVKSNIGHLEGASGIAGVIKTILTLERAVIPPNTNFRCINPKIDPDSLRIKFPVAPTPWPTKGRRRASVNSFGFGGTNAHAILDDAFHFLRDHGLVGNHNSVSNAPPAELLYQSGSFNSPAEGNKDSDHEASFPKLLVLSAFDKRGLTRLVTEYRRYFTEVSISSSFDAYLENLAYTLHSRRSLLPWKSYFVAQSTHDLRKVDSEISPGRRSVSTPLLGFIFTGQGAQWAGMGRDLRIFDVFDKKIREADKYLIGLGCPWHLREELLRPQDQTNINKPEFSQPISTAVQVALVDLLRSFGIIATAVVGHSSGEIAAAYCLGAISAKSAWRIAYYRGKFSAALVQTGQRNGAMISVGLSEAQIRPYIDQITDHFGACRLSIACINSPKNVTLSGDADQIDTLEDNLKNENIFAHKIAVGVAYHSYHMQGIAQDYGLSIQNLEKGSFIANAVMISSVTGQRVEGTELCSSEYWVKNMLSPVKFSSAVGQLCGGVAKRLRKKLDRSHRDHSQVNILLEIGPHSALQGPIRDILAEIPGGANINYTSVLIRRQSSLRSVLDCCGQLHCLGYSIDLNEVNRLKDDLSKRPRPLEGLPEYSFDHSQKHWDESRVSRRYRLHHQNKLDLLGRPDPDWNPLEAKWRNVIRISEMSWVTDHMINGKIIYPAAGMLVMAIEAANQIVDPARTVTGFEIKDALFLKALQIPQDSEGVETNIYLRQKHEVSEDTATWLEFRLCSLENDDWSENCRGSIRVKYQAASGAVDRGRESSEELALCQGIDERLSHSCAKTFEPSQLYETLKQSGFGFGHAFQPLKNGFWNDMNEVKSDIILYQWPASEYPQHHIVHPTTLDGILHLSLAALSLGGHKSISTSVPTLLRKMWIAKSGLSRPQNALVNGAAWMTAMDSRGADCDISILDTSKTHVLARVQGLRSTVVADFAESSAERLHHQKQVCYHLEVKPDLALLDQKQLSTFCASARLQLREPVQFYQDLTFCLLVFLSRSVEAVDATQVLQPHLQHYLDWAKLQLRRYERGELPCSKPEWRLLLQDNEIIESICNSVAGTNDQGRVFITTGRRLTEILRGKVDPLDFFFKSSILKDLYREVNDSRTCFPEFTRYLDASGHKNPNMKILEIGAGTGSTTAKILSTLSIPIDGEHLESRYSSYHYTDISAYFFEQARADFQHYPNIVYSTLDIDSDPCLQGYTAESYDLIIAANVLHATKDINATAKHIRKLLNSGGKLMIYEPTRPEILRTGFITGLMSGWWLGIESYRQWTPLLSCDSWRKVLCDNGFSGIDLELPDFVSPECQEGSIIVSTATSNTVEDTKFDSIVIIVDLCSILQVNVAESLKAMLMPEDHLHCEIRSYEEAVSLEDKSKLSFIFLEELERPLLGDLSPEKYPAIQELLTSCKSVLWITDGGGSDYSKRPEYAIVNGLSRVLRNENPERPFATLALDIHADVTEKQIQLICRVFHQVLGTDHESAWYDSEFVEVDGFLSIPRVIPDRDLSQELFARSLPNQSKTRIFGELPPMRLAIVSPGLLDTLCFVEDEDYGRSLASDEVEIEVQAIGMNFKDCLTALGRVPDSSFGSECAGVVTRVGESCPFVAGDRVLMAAAETFKTFARGNVHLVHKINDEMTVLEAASIPSQFGTAWQAVHELARLRRGETILIHAGAGGTGQAAIQISQYLGGEVFATVGSEAKRDLLIKEYGITENRIFDSRDASFAKGVMRVTGNKGVDVIINSLAGDSLIASWECIAPYGRFIEIGKKDILANSSLPMYPFRKNVSFICFDGYTWQLERPLQAQETFRVLLDLFAQSKLHTARPLHAYSISQAEEVFRLMQDGRMAGKAVLQVTPDAQVPTKLATAPSFHIDGNGTYLIAGGLGGLGRSIARWLVTRGAKNLILLSRSGAKSDASRTFLEDLKQQGIRTLAPACDVTVASSMQTVLERCAIEMPPIKGCVQGSMVLRDAVFDKMIHGDWQVGTECKTIGSWNLHSLLPRDLDFFIMLSSASGIVGLRGQANYAAGNTYMDALARYRVARGERAVSLDLGALTDDGLLAENPDLLNRVLGYGALNPISREQCFAILDYYCDPALPLLTPCHSQPIIGLGAGAEPSLEGMGLSRQPIFKHVRKNDASLVFSDASAETNTDFKELFSKATSLEEAGAVISQALIRKLSRNLSTLQGDIDLHQPLAAYGVDSLLAVELRTWIAKIYSADVAAFEISGDSTFSTASQLVASRSKLKHESWKM